MSADGGCEGRSMPTAVGFRPKSVAGDEVAYRDELTLARMHNLDWLR